jgi:hypothetical protein
VVDGVSRSHPAFRLFDGDPLGLGPFFQHRRVLYL